MWLVFWATRSAKGTRKAINFPVRACTQTVGIEAWKLSRTIATGQVSKLSKVTGLQNDRCSWPRGKVFGGSSMLNYMLYVHCNKRDYDGWEKLGNPGLSCESVLPYFKKSEDNRNPSYSQTRHHSTGGYLTVQEAPQHTPPATAFAEGGQGMGYEARDINGKYQTGFMIARGTIRGSSRCSTAKAFLRPAKSRQNLHVALEAHLTKILIDMLSRRAYGV
ncbi:hypothetical protein K0M31_002326 [Melipona bicolor]|uniref:Glucose-methanol-choline oxidoreductase N-terminal domain-containing protein n=2 Tax=Melipona bicolor TaxID=60889 RepID=A0AA40GHD1_9HYME|nr:hypothetical protein K0M31_002326 [Melipona bicolor]